LGFLISTVKISLADLYYEDTISGTYGTMSNLRSEQLRSWIYMVFAEATFCWWKNTIYQRESMNVIILG
nr:hypothetical protein [Tanacetum cinerariifolium]